MIDYPQHKQLSKSYINSKVTEFLLEDIPNGDKTTQSNIPEATIIKAEVQALEELVFAGEEIIPLFFGDDCQVTINIEDGALVTPIANIADIRGPAQIILSRERVMLNLLQHLCGIATLSRQYADLAKPFNVKILDTRKTTPGLRLFEKYAVAVGGAFNHRLNLSEGILIKDNHLVSAGSVSQAIRAARDSNAKLPLELEVDNLEQIKEAIPIGVDGFLLDNMKPETIRKAVSLIRNAPKGKEIFIEASGGISLRNIQPYLDTGIDAISIGALTHSSTSKDIRLEFIK